uniref:Uncharacterized protein n=1 Tax=Globodera rostochiensis TaxID=31243 RepID=A0A914HSR0_GLORO
MARPYPFSAEEREAVVARGMEAVQEAQKTQTYLSLGVPQLGNTFKQKVALSISKARPNASGGPTQFSTAAFMPHGNVPSKMDNGDGNRSFSSCRGKGNDDDDQTVVERIGKQISDVCAKLRAHLVEFLLLRQLCVNVKTATEKANLILKQIPDLDQDILASEISDDEDESSDEEEAYNLKVSRCRRALRAIKLPTILAICAKTEDAFLDNSDKVKSIIKQIEKLRVPGPGAPMEEALRRSQEVQKLLNAFGRISNFVPLLANEEQTMKDLFETAKNTAADHSDGFDGNQKQLFAEEMQKAKKAYDALLKHNLDNLKQRFMEYCVKMMNELLTPIMGERALLDNFFDNIYHASYIPEKLGLKAVDMELPYSQIKKLDFLYTNEREKWGDEFVAFEKWFEKRADEITSRQHILTTRKEFDVEILKLRKYQFGYQQRSKLAEVVKCPMTSSKLELLNVYNEAIGRTEMICKNLVQKGGQKDDDQHEFKNWADIITSRQPILTMIKEFNDRWIRQLEEAANCAMTSSKLELLNEFKEAIKRAQMICKNLLQKCGQKIRADLITNRQHILTMIKEFNDRWILQLEEAAKCEMTSSKLELLKELKEAIKRAQMICGNLLQKSGQKDDDDQHESKNRADEITSRQHILTMIKEFNDRWIRQLEEAENCPMTSSKLELLNEFKEAIKRAQMIYENFLQKGGQKDDDQQLSFAELVEKIMEDGGGFSAVLKHMDESRLKAVNGNLSKWLIDSFNKFVQEFNKNFKNFGAEEIKEW